MASGEMITHSISENVTEDGRLVLCEWHNTTLRNADDEVIAILAIAQDVTERHRNLEKLTWNVSLLAEAQSLAHIGSWNWDVARNTIIWSDEHYRIFGLRPQELAMSHERFLSLVHPDDRVIVQNKLDEAYRDRQLSEHCFRALRPDGTVRVVQARGQVVFDEDDKPVRIFGAVQDITERIRAEEAIEKSRRRFQAVFENSLDGILIFDDAGSHLNANPAMCQLLGYRHDDLVHMTIWDITPASDRERVRELLAQLLSAGNQSGNVSVLCKGGETRLVEYRAVKNILPGAHLSVQRDITERRRAEEALRDSAARLRILSRRVIDVQEEERRHLARELHDEIGQELCAISVSLHAVNGVCDAAAVPRVEESIRIVDQAIQQVRNLSLDLRPSMLDDLGLAAAVRSCADRQAQRAGFAVHFAAEFRCGPPARRAENHLLPGGAGGADQRGDGTRGLATSGSNCGRATRRSI